MFNLLQIIQLPVGAVHKTSLAAKLIDAGMTLPGVIQSKAGLTLPRALNGGDLMWRLGFTGEDHYRKCMTSPVWREVTASILADDSAVILDHISYRSAFSDITSEGTLGGIWRCLCLSVEQTATSAQIASFEKDTLLMPQHVSKIRNWSLGTVVNAMPARRRWTHVWEQEFDSVEDLEGEYMFHPIHWGVVDGWFDPECPQRIVDPFLIHAAISIKSAIIV